jgi:hypothetical protein
VHQTSSPHYHQSNGKAESAVKRAKRMLKETTRAGEDQYLALLNIRNIPSPETGTSPAQRLLGRRTKTILPTTTRLLEETPPSKHENEQLKLLQKRQAAYYNKHAQDLPALQKGDVVRMKPHQLGQKEWKKAIILEKLDERSYEVEADEGGTYRRNRVHLKKTMESPCQEKNTCPNDLPIKTTDTSPSPMITESPTEDISTKNPEPPKSRIPLTGA